MKKNRTLCKKTVLSFLLALLLLVFLPLGMPMTARAEETQSEETESADLWKTKLRRVNDFSETLEKTERDDLNARIRANIDELRFDFVICLFHEDNVLSSDTLGGYTDWLYTANGMGYGVNGDGIILAIDVDNDRFVIRAYGRGVNIFKPASMNELSLSVRNGFAEDGYIGACEAFFAKAGETVKNSEVIYRDYEYSYGNGKVIEATSLTRGETAEWFPADVSAFTFFHDEEADRIIDLADLISDEVEELLREQMADISARTGKDVVILTDTGTYGYSHRVYALDFYDFNGYGIGEDFDGILLFVDMDPEDRGWWVLYKGSLMEINTEDAGEDMDDRLYDYMAAGKYEIGIADWVDAVDNLLSKGDIYAPEWIPDLSQGWVRTHDTSGILLADDADFFTDSEEKEINAMLAELSGKLGFDVRIITADYFYHRGPRTYSEEYWTYHGYGSGDSFEGVAYLISENYSYISAFGDVGEKWEAVYTERLEQKLDDQIEKGDLDKSLTVFRKNMEWFAKHGKITYTVYGWIGMMIVSGIVGLIIAGIRLISASSRMKTVKRQYNADDYLLSDSFRVIRSTDEFLRTEKSSVYRPVERSSGGGSSGGGSHSSHSSSYSGSSGSSGGGHGRSF